MQIAGLQTFYVGISVTHGKNQIQDSRLFMKGVDSAQFGQQTCTDHGHVGPAILSGKVL